MQDVETKRDQAYYAISIERADNADGEDYPFFVNCAGEASFKKKIHTDNRRGRNDYYFMYVQSGFMNLTFNGKRSKISAGDFLCLPPHTPYAYDNSDCDERVRYYWIHFTGKDVQNIVKTCLIEPSRLTTIGIAQSVDKMFEELFSEFRNRQSNFQYAIGLKAQYILMTLARYEKRSDEAKALDTSIRYIHENLKEKLSVEALADMEFLSVSRYRELFRKVTGFSPSEYIARQRIHRASDMIEQGVSLSRAAEVSGFSDRLYFQRVFKKVMGITPGEYRKKYL